MSSFLWTRTCYIWSTKFWEPWINPAWQSQFYAYTRVMFLREMGRPIRALTCCRRIGPGPPSGRAGLPEARPIQAYAKWC